MLSRTKAAGNYRVCRCKLLIAERSRTRSAGCKLHLGRIVDWPTERVWVGRPFAGSTVVVKFDADWIKAIRNGFYVGRQVENMRASTISMMISGHVCSIPNGKYKGKKPKRRRRRRDFFPPQCVSSLLRHITPIVKTYLSIQLRTVCSVRPIRISILLLLSRSPGSSMIYPASDVHIDFLNNKMCFS